MSHKGRLRKLKRDLRVEPDGFICSREYFDLNVEHAKRWLEKFLHREPTEPEARAMALGVLKKAPRCLGFGFDLSDVGLEDSE